VAELIDLVLTGLADAASFVKSPRVAIVMALLVGLILAILFAVSRHA
jgi:hypothetical protein